MTRTDSVRSPQGLLARVRAIATWAFRPIDIAWLVAFRVLLGSVLCVSMLRFLAYGWVDKLFATPTFFFKYWGFDWVTPLSASGMQWLFVALAACALATAFGLLFRPAAIGLALGLSYVQLLDVSTYLNHYYLAALLTWLLALSPASRAWSIDSWVRRGYLARRSARSGEPPTERSERELIPAAWLYLLRVQVGVVYTFAGLAKAQSDWLVHAQPLRIWLGSSAELPGIGPLLLLGDAPLLMSWAGFLFDTTIVGWLSWRRTRLFAFAVVVVFHVLTRVLFPIGMFPAIMITGALLFFDPSWPRHLASALRSLPLVRGRFTATRISRLRTGDSELRPPLVPRGALTRFGWVLAASYCVVQIALPLRFIAYGGNVLWHEQGMRFSWRVMVRAKGGATEFVVNNPDSGRSWRVAPGSYLTPMQESEMAAQPDLILQLAHHIEADFNARGLGPVEVRARSRATLNGRRSAPLVDPNVDLTTIEDGLSLARYVMPAPTSEPPKTRLVP